jgi:hypothetical protein
VRRPKFTTINYLYTLAMNAGARRQSERFYARNLPLSAEMAKNLQSFGA